VKTTAMPVERIWTWYKPLAEAEEKAGAAGCQPWEGLADPYAL
jgi:hypothetical protein